MHTSIPPNNEVGSWVKLELKPRMAHEVLQCNLLNNSNFSLVLELDFTSRHSLFQLSRNRFHIKQINRQHARQVTIFDFLTQQTQFMEIYQSFLNYPKIAKYIFYSYEVGYTSVMASVTPSRFLVQAIEQKVFDLQ